MDKPENRFCLTHSSGEDIYLFRLVNSRGSEILLTNYGAIITALRIKNPEGELRDMVLGFDRVEDYWSSAYLSNHPWFGCAVGRYANRIKNASFGLDGKEYKLEGNHHKEHLHGGISGFDKKAWEIMSSGTRPNPYLMLRLLSRDGEEGYPGNLETSIRFELNDEDELSYEFEAISDQATPVNLTHHSYFNLQNGAGNITGHELRIAASHYLGQEGNRLASGVILPVENTEYDLRNFLRIGDGLQKLEEFDNSFVVDNPSPGEPGLVAEARCPESGFQLQVLSTEPIVHFYSGKWIPQLNGRNGKSYGPFSGFCLETHRYPNAVNIPQFPSTILRPGERYYQKTVYRISQVREK